MEKTKSNKNIGQHFLKNIQKKYKNFLLAIFTIGSLTTSNAQMNPQRNLSFFHTSPWEYQDPYLDSLFSSLEDTNSSDISLKEALRNYLPSDIHKGMILCSSEKRAEILKKLFSEENHSFQKEEYLHYRDTLLNIRQENIPEQGISLIQVSYNPDNKNMMYQYVFYHDRDENRVGYCPDAQMRHNDKITTRKLENNMIALIIEGEEGTISLYIGDSKEARTGDLGFIYPSNGKEYFPAGIKRYKDKQKCIFKKIINNKIIQSNDLKTLLLKIGSKEIVSPEEIDSITDENCEVIAQPMIK